MNKCRLEVSPWRNMAHLQKGFNRLEIALQRLMNSENRDDFHYKATREAMKALEDVKELLRPPQKGRD